MRTTGAGPACVFLHGWGLHSGIWSEVAPALARRYQVILADLPGHGQSEPPQGEYTLTGLASALAEILPARAILIGWSLGGMVALELAARFPERISQLVLVASTPQFVATEAWPYAISPEILEDFARRLRQDYATTIRHFLTLQVMGSEHERRTLARLRNQLSCAPPPHVAALEGGLKILQQDSLLPILTAVTMPVTLIHGSRDTLVPWTASRALRDRLPHARLHVMRGAAHAPFLSHPDEFLRILGELTDD